MSDAGPYGVIIDVDQDLAVMFVAEVLNVYEDLGRMGPIDGVDRVDMSADVLIVVEFGPSSVELTVADFELKDGEGTVVVVVHDLEDDGAVVT